MGGEGPVQELCLNCQATLAGPFCAQCGQSARHSARSVGTLLGEAFESITNLDGRLWGTVGRLLLGPGRLTVEYLADRRVRYLPPFRIYLVVSLLFFALALTGRGDRDRQVADDAPLSDAERREEARKAEERVKACAGIPDIGGATVKSVTQSACRRVAADEGRKLKTTFLQVLPNTMFLFLPLLALALFVLFFRQRRFYVEHLIFGLHFQAGLFALFGLGLLIESLGKWTQLDDAADLLFLGVFAYMGWYTWRSLRLVYGQGRVLTALKMTMFAFAYALLLGCTLLATLIFSAVSR
jgi:hypothetical protein